ncbi:exosortase A [Nitrogeniibacter aestuarii]|uniref:exosortase A n=1 Tax=Nitrogeniibacter aestuarii TaxID=2815343 RepID=UPI001D116C4E|nr:exosortase A [Nitrogeniibacter aestuarii]
MTRAMAVSPPSDEREGATAPEAAQKHTPAAFVAMAAVFVAWLVGFWGSAAGMWHIWSVSATFAHGFVVLPIAVYLVWLKRGELTRMVPDPDWLAVLPLALSTAVWVAGIALSISVVEHVFAVFALISAMWLALGRAIFKRLLFPLCFLLFMAPAGDFLVPTLMHYTAEFTVGALRAVGVPVFQEGNHFVLPNGRWSVVEACSGIRYLIASFMVGTLFAYLNYRSAVRRTVFAIFSLLLPIVANWLRAFMIVMLGYLSDNKIAAGVDHLIYGWVFFGFVILFMFWVGNRWAEPEPSGDSLAVPVARERRGAYAGALVACVCLVASAALATLSTPIERQLDVSLELPADLNGWQPAQGLNYRPSLNGYRAYAERTYASEVGIIGIHVGVYAHQVPGKELVHWSNRLTPKEDDVWRVIDQRRVRLDGIEAERMLFDSPRRRLTVWSWYQIGDRAVSGEVMAKLLTAQRRVLTGSDAGARIVVVVPDEGDAANAVFERFMADNGLALRTLVLKAEAGLL